MTLAGREAVSGGRGGLSVQYLEHVPFMRQKELTQMDQMAGRAEQVTTGSGTFDVVNPATREVVGSYPVHTADHVATIVAQAREAQRWWEGLGFEGRKPYLQRW